MSLNVLGVRWGGGLVLTGCSIREFCALEMPILMFDKNQDYVVLRLGQVCWSYERWIVFELLIWTVYSFCHFRLGRISYPLLRMRKPMLLRRRQLRDPLTPSDGKPIDVQSGYFN